MSEQDELSAAERELETALRSLAPATARLDPVAAAFEAGRRSRRRSLRLWQSAAAAILLVSAGLWLAPARHDGFVLTNREVSTPLADATRAAQPRTEQSMFKLGQAVWEKGVDGIPVIRLPPASPARANDVTSIYQGEI